MDDIQPRIRQLASDIDRLEAAVRPLLLSGSASSPSASASAKAAAKAAPTASSSSASSTLTPATPGHASAALHLPLLDRAKLHVLACFALESTIYCNLDLAGGDARNHAVFRELERVRQYMKKIDAADNPPVPPSSRLDKSAAIRFVKADLTADLTPAMKAQLDQLLKEEQAAAVAETGAAGGGRASQNASPRGGRKRGGGPMAGSPAGSGSSHLTKRPKYSDREGRGRGQSTGRGRST